MQEASKDFTEQQVQELVELTRRRAKPGRSRYLPLTKHEASIRRMMDRNISLPVIRDWLEKQGEKVALNTLRKFVVLHVGSDIYDAYRARNGWRRRRGALAAPPKAEEAAGPIENHRHVSQGWQNPEAAGQQSVRRGNLRLLTGRRGAATRLGKLIGVPRKRLSLLCTSYTTISNRFCVRVEKVLGLPVGWMSVLQREETIPAETAAKLCVEEDKQNESVGRRTAARRTVARLSKVLDLAHAETAPRPSSAVRALGGFAANPISQTVRETTKTGQVVSKSANSHNIVARVRELVRWCNDDAQFLEERTRLKAQRWREVIEGPDSKITAAIIEKLGRAWPELVFWLITGSDECPVSQMSGPAARIAVQRDLAARLLENAGMGHFAAAVLTVPPAGEPARVEAHTWAISALGVKPVIETVLKKARY